MSSKIIKKAVVMQSNRIIKSRQNLSTKEKKLFIQLILNLNCYEDSLECSVSANAFAELAGIDVLHRRRDIKALLESFQTKCCFIEEPNGSWKRYIWCPTAEFDSETSMIHMRLNSDLKDDFIGLKSHFTQYILEDILSVTGTYSARVYELLMEKRKHEGLKWQGEFLIEDLRLLTLGHKSTRYKDQKDFFKRVIDPSIDEINNNTQMTVKYEKIKKGRAFKKVLFKCSLSILKRDPRQPLLDL